QRHDPGLISCQTALAQKAVDAIAQERAFHRPLFVHASAETTSRSVPFGRTTSDRRYFEPAARRTPSVTTHSSTITSDSTSTSSHRTDRVTRADGLMRTFRP